MEFEKRKNALLLCASVGCHHMATHYFKLRKNSIIFRVGLCENCSFELRANLKKGGDI